MLSSFCASTVAFVTPNQGFPSSPSSALPLPSTKQSLPSARVAVKMSEQKQEQDIVEKVFGFFFGQKEEEPLGLKRFNKETFPDQFPATLTEFAEPVAGDSKEVAIFRPYLKQTELESRNLKLVYDAKRNGWKANAFHKAVDKKGPGVIFAKTAGGAVIGGYNPKGWVGYGEFRPGISAFLFTWPDGDTSKKPFKLRKIGGAGLAVMDNPEQGPMFGADSLCIPMNPSQERLCRCNLGAYYERLPGGVKSIFAEGENPKGTELVELKAYIGVYGKDEEVPFTDAIPFSLT